MAGRVSGLTLLSLALGFCLSNLPDKGLGLDLWFSRGPAGKPGW